MALTKSQMNGVIDMFVASFVNSDNKKERKRIFIEFEDIFGKGIVDWQNICREKIEKYTSDSVVVECFDEFVCRKEKQDDNADIMIRLLTENDLEQVRELINTAFTMTLTFYDDDKFKKFIESGYSVVACNGEEILGVALAYEIPNLNVSSIYLDTFTVAEHMRNRGIGKKMLSYIRSLALTDKVYALTLHTDRNIEAYEVYKHWGFEEDKWVYMKKYIL